MSGVVVLGLGPAGWESLTTEAADLLRAAPELWLRTLRHPTVDALRARRPDLRLCSFDDLYDGANDFASLYEEIARQVLDLGERPDGVLYAVPGSPSIGETTVALIRSRARERGLPLRLIPGLSFLEPVCTALAIDPLDGLQVVDATDLARITTLRELAQRAAVTAPLLAPQLYNRRVAAAVKALLVDAYGDEHGVRLVGSAGLPTQWLRDLPLYEIDRQDDLDHLTTLFVPPLDPLAALRCAQGLEQVVHRLRAPGGCPWDREQTHASLRPYLLEETFEALEALDNEDWDAFAGELGDVLLQVYLHAEIAGERGDFTLATVHEHIARKLIRRHPHVFGDVQVSGAEQVIQNWDAIKRQERAEQAGVIDASSLESPLAGVPRTLPALAYAQALQRRAARDPAWATAPPLIVDRQSALSAPADAAEMGRLLFALADMARRADMDAEEALRRECRAFIARFDDR